MNNLTQRGSVRIKSTWPRYLQSVTKKHLLSKFYGQVKRSYIIHSFSELKRRSMRLNTLGYGTTTTLAPKVLIRTLTFNGRKNPSQLDRWY